MGKISLGNSVLTGTTYEESTITLHNNLSYNVYNNPIDIVYFHNGKAYNIRLEIGTEKIIKTNMIIWQHYANHNVVGVSAVHDITVPYEDTYETGRLYRISSDNATPTSCIYVPLLDESDLWFFDYHEDPE